MSDIPHNAWMSEFVLDTYSGLKLDLDDPQPDQIALEDIAAALSKVCRSGAQATRFYSVAQHAVVVSELVMEAGREHLVLPALHHDSHEAYLGDVPTPVKRKLGFDQRISSYYNLVEAIDTAIARCFYTSFVTDRNDIAAIKRADRQALLAEAAVLLHDKGEGVRKALAQAGVDPDELEPLPIVDQFLSPEEAQARFLQAHAAAA